MPSRMEKYYKNEKTEYKRTERNKKLYDEIYTSNNYDHIDELTGRLKEDKIDLNSLHELLSSKSHVEKEIISFDNQIEELEEEKKYDLNDLISKAKTERIDEDSVYKKVNLENTSNVNIENIINEISSSLEKEGDDLISDLDMEETKKIEEKEIDKSFYTSTLDLSKDDYEVEEFEEKKGNGFLIFILIILILILVAGISFGVFYLLNN